MSAEDACPRCGLRYPTARLGACPRCLLEGEESPVVVGGDLELDAEVGRGGMGSVWRARHRRLGRTVAVKFLPEALAAKPEFRARFEREARTLALLSHPNIVAVHDVGEDEGRPYIVMEFVAGKSLAELLPLAPERAAAVVAQAGDALAYAHGRGIVHRDVKPENILIDADGRVKVTDFGIARAAGPDGGGPALTATGERFGTPHYVAPEAMAGAPPDPRMDVYALGVVLYQTLTGKLPVGHFTPAPAPYDRIVRRALAPDPERRYASAAEMAEDLRRAAGTGALAAGFVALPPDEMTWVRVVALLQSISTAVATWAFVKSVTPRVIRPDEVMPLIMVGVETLADGRMVSWARFETWWTILALATFAPAITGYGLLRRHWRLAGLETREPDRPVPEARTVFAWGVIAIAAYIVPLILKNRGILPEWDRYRPIVGAMIEVAALHTFWVALLTAWRTGRPFRREPRIWLGFGLALVPPALELVRFIVEWKP